MKEVLSVQCFLFIKREISCPGTCAVPFFCHPTCDGAHDFSHGPPSWLDLATPLKKSKNRPCKQLMHSTNISLHLCSITSLMWKMHDVHNQYTLFKVKSKNLCSSSKALSCNCNQIRPKRDSFGIGNYQLKWSVGGVMEEEVKGWTLLSFCTRYMATLPIVR